MLDAKIIQEVERLPLKERLTLLEILARSVQREISAQTGKRKESSLGRVLGALRSEHKLPPSDEEMKEDYINYLIKKYS